MKVSVIIPVKNRLAHLQQSLPLVLKQSHQDIEVIVVDYNCPQETWRWVSGVVSPKVKCVIAQVEENEWSLSAARNLGYKNSTGEMLLFLDADALLTDVDFLIEHINHCVDGSFVCGWGHHEATGCMLIRKTAFEAVHGYNEELQAWGYEDIDIYERLQYNVANEKRVWLGGVSTIKHGDELRNYYHGGINPLQTNELNYRIAKTKFKGL